MSNNRINKPSSAFLVRGLSSQVRSLTRSNEKCCWYFLISFIKQLYERNCLLKWNVIPNLFFLFHLYMILRLLLKWLDDVYSSRRRVKNHQVYFLTKFLLIEESCLNAITSDWPQANQPAPFKANYPSIRSRKFFVFNCYSTIFYYIPTSTE